MRVKAVYSGETKFYYYFLLFEPDKKIVGTFYVRKNEPLPLYATVDLLTPNHTEWSEHIGKLVERSRDGSKAEQKLIDVVDRFEKGDFHE